jgi:hypothetical protein
MKDDAIEELETTDCRPSGSHFDVFINRDDGNKIL